MSRSGRKSRKAYETFANACVHGEPPACSVACPLNLEVREIVGPLQKGNFTAAYKAYRTKAVFPEIVAEICDEPCKAGCVRGRLDDSISMRLLEKAAVEFARAKAVPRFNLPRRPERIAVIGAGLAGVTCAVKLAAKSYQVTIYEKSDRLGGRLWDLMDPDIFLPALQEQLEVTECEVRLGSEITSLDGLDAEVIVVATGAGGETFGLLEGRDPRSYGTAHPGVFLIGNLLGTTPVQDIAQGRIAAFSVEKYLKVGAMDGMPETFPLTRVAFEMDLSTVESRPAVVPGGRAGAEGAAAPRRAAPGGAGTGDAAPGARPTYDQQEARAEADRCLLCDCNLCSDACELFGSVRRMPKQMVNDAIASLHSTKSAGSVRAMNSCNLCGLCGKVCPQGIDMGTFYRDFRVFKREDGLLPAAFHEFFMNDLRHADGEAYLARTAPGHDQAGYVFFPGCQLAASDPRHVELTYHHLLEAAPDTALILGCCGAPAEWGAETGLRDGIAEKLRAEWERFGRPVFVFACATCRLQFERHLPGVPGTSLYELLLEVGLPAVDTGGAAETGGDANAASTAEACVFDPCSSRGYGPMQQSVRRIAEAAGIGLTDLPFSGEQAQCCGWGGHIAVANPKLLDTMVRDRTGAAPLPYVTYCANCQEVFSRGGKDSRHILDIVLGLAAAEGPRSLGQRRANRMAAKRAVLEREWGEDMTDATGGEPGGTGQSGAAAPVAISDELLARMYAERILEDDVYRTVGHCEDTSTAVYDPERNLYIGHLRIGALTYWVEYSKSDEGIALHSVFCHRAEILER